MTPRSRTPGTLTPEQQRGAACVWCAAPLRPGVTDIDLGPRRWRPSDGAEVAWFPRTCPNCYYLQGASDRQRSARALDRLVRVAPRPRRRPRPHRHR
nr:hypothetical protein [Streptomyces sp. SA3_actF]